VKTLRRDGTGPSRLFHEQAFAFCRYSMRDSLILTGLNRCLARRDRMRKNTDFFAGRILTVA
jgi:hypothetical protein